MTKFRINSAAHDERADRYALDFITSTERFIGRWFKLLKHSRKKLTIRRQKNVKDRIMPNLEIAKCCGTCVWTNQKKRPQPEDHAAHYTVAKTERWCQKFNLPTVREAVCPNWELEPKKGGTPAVKRALKQNKRLAAILALKARLEKEKKITWEGYTFAISADDRVVYSWLRYDSESWRRVDCKESRFDKFLDL